MILYNAKALSIIIGSIATATYVALQTVAGNPVAGVIGEGTVIGVISFLGSYFMLKQKVDDIKEDLAQHKTSVGVKLDLVAKDIKDISKSVNELVGESRVRAVGHLRTRSSDTDSAD